MKRNSDEKKGERTRNESVSWEFDGWSWDWTWDVLIFLRFWGCNPPPPPQRRPRGNLDHHKKEVFVVVVVVVVVVVGDGLPRNAIHFSTWSEIDASNKSQRERSVHQRHLCCETLPCSSVDCWWYLGALATSFLWKYSIPSIHESCPWRNDF